MYFKDPYKTYYEFLVQAKEMISTAKKVSDSSENACLVIERLKSMVENSNWKELGHFQLVFNLLPILKERAQLLYNNISGMLSRAVEISINVLLPILEEIKVKDEELNEINAKLAALVEPVYDDSSNYFDFCNPKEEYDRYLAEKAELSERSEKLDNELKLLIEDADNTIEKIKTLNGGVNDSESLFANAEEFINQNGNSFDILDIEYVKTNPENSSITGNYFIVTFKNGKKLYLHEQIDGGWGAIDIEDSINGPWDGGGGCSVFATSAAFSWMLDQYISPREVMMAGGGQLPGLQSIIKNKKTIHIDGKEYVINAEVSDIKQYGGWYGENNKENIVKEWRNTLNNGGIVAIAVSGRDHDFLDYSGDNIRVVESLPSIIERTGIDSDDGGHVIAMVGLTDDGKVIFADSKFYSIDGEPPRFAYDKDLTLDEFFDLFGGTETLNVPFSEQTYVTVNNATLEKV